MRRKDREITDYGRMIEIVKNCECCRIGLVDDGVAYIVPMNFGFTSGEGKLTLYFHCATVGKKIDLIREQNIASFEMDGNHKLVIGETACDFSYMYQSVMGKGIIQVIEQYDEKVLGLQKIMEHYSGNQVWDFKKEAVDRVCILRLEVTEWSCKAH